MTRSPVWLLLGFPIGFALAALPYSLASGLGAISTSLSSANAEIRGPILTAISLILAAFVLITVGAGIVRVITRSS